MAGLRPASAQWYTLALRTVVAWWHKCDYEILNLPLGKFPSSTFKLVKLILQGGGSTKNCIASFKI